MSNKIIPSGYVKSVLQNGVGRYVCQLQRLTIKFCKSHGSSRGVRDFIENDLLEFTHKHPGVVVYLKPRRHHTPKLVAEYLNGRTEYQSLHKHDQAEVRQWVGFMRTRSGQEIVRLRKHWHTDTPSIQGIWTPMTNRDTSWNVRQYPDPELSTFSSTPKSASEILLEKAEELRKVDGQNTNPVDTVK